MNHIEAGIAAIGNGGALPAFPEFYGAVGDGVTNDTAALNSWAASGVNLCLTPGKTYLHRQAINVTTGGIVIDGQGGTLKRAAQVSTTTTTTITSGVTTQITVASATGLVVGDAIVVEQSGNYDLTQRFITNIAGTVITVATAFGISLSGTINVRTGWNQMVVTGHNVQVKNITFDGNKSNWTWARWPHTSTIFAGDNSTPWENILIDHNRLINQPGDGIAPTGVLNCIVAFNDLSAINGRGVAWAGAGTPGNDAGGRCIFNRFINTELDATVTQSDGVGGGDGNGAINLSSGILDLLVEGNQIDTSISGIASINSTGNSNISIRNNVIRNTSSYAIEGVMSNVSPVTNVVICGNRIYSCGDVRVILGSGSGATGWIIRDNTFWETALYVSNVQQVAITDNWFYSATITSGAKTFISLENSGGAVGVQQSIVARNQIFGGKYAIEANTGTSEILIADNQCIGQYDTALFLQGAAPNVSVRNNHLAPSAASSKVGWNGIYTTGAGISIQGNNVDMTTFTGFTGAGITLNGQAKATVMGNIVRLGANTGGKTIYALGGTTFAIIKDNIVDQAPTDSGTSTTLLGNVVNGGPMNGKVALVAGTKTISTAEVLTGDTILLSNVLVGGTVGTLSVGTIVNKTSFVINSSNAADTSTVYWEIRH